MLHIDLCWILAVHTVLNIEHDNKIICKPAGCFNQSWFFYPDSNLEFNIFCWISLKCVFNTLTETNLTLNCVRLSLKDCLFNTAFAFDRKQHTHAHTHTHIHTHMRAHTCACIHSDPHNQFATCSLVISANISITPCSVCSSLSFPVVLKVFIFPSLIMCVRSPGMETVCNN